MNYQEAYKYLTECVTPGSLYGLERVSELAKRLGVPYGHSKIIHVAGTNGKGSTSRMLASILKESGFCVGIFNSPYLVAPTEYLCVNGIDAQEQEYADVISEIKDTIDKWSEDKNASFFEMPTEFELSVCAALLYFKNKKCDYIILECGLGGLTDATNFIPSPQVAVITNIGLDHTGFLGDSIEKIAEQKAGIIKPGCEVVVYPSCNEALNVFVMKSIKNKCNFYVADNDVAQYRNDIALFGDFQKKNAAVAIKVVEVLNKLNSNLNDSEEAYITEDNIRAGLKKVVWPGRFEIIRQNPYLIVDGGHNDQCIDMLIESLDQLKIENALFVVGVMADKTHMEMFGKLAKYAQYVITTEPANKRRLSAKEALDEWKSLGVKGESVERPYEAIRRAVEISDNKMDIIVCGSLYMVGEVKQSLNDLGMK